MGLFSKKSGQSEKANGQPSVQFGRYTDRHKTPDQLKCWDESLRLYKEKKYVEAYDQFLHYLRDAAVDNVKITKEANKVNFEIIQGSKLVTGYADNTKIEAEAEIASFENKPHVAVMRKLLSVNYDLFFSKFAMKDNVYTLKFSAPVQDANPHALYSSLKEVANQSDKYDDVLTDEFSFLSPVNTDHIEELPEKEKEVKYETLKKMIKSTLDRSKELNEKDLSGAVSFRLLQLTFKLYYLMAPEGVLLDDLRYIQGIFFRKDNANTAERNHLMIEEFNKILNRSKEDLLKSLYRTKATFAVVTPTAFKTISDFIYNEIGKLNWYRDNKYFDVQQAVCDYIVAYCEFFYGMDAPVYDFFDIYWKATNSSYYKDLGFSVDYYNEETEKFKQSDIENDISKIIKAHKGKFPYLDFKVHTLKYDNLAEFSASFLYEVEKLNLNLQ